MRISDWSSDVCSSDLTQQKAAAAYIAQLTRAHAFKMPIVTRLERGGFYPAEAYHQDFYRRNPTHPYIVHWDKPKVAAFRAASPNLATYRRALDQPPCGEARRSEERRVGQECVSTCRYA